MQLLGFPEPPVEADSEIDVDVGVDIDAQVEVEVQPIVIDVFIGASLLGGALELSIDPRMLPLRESRKAAAVQVEIIGPRAQATRAQAELHAAAVAARNSS